MKKNNNKGFSLVELIVVVAIMAVLVGVLAPAYLRYVEKSRIQKDVSAVSEVVQAVKIASADAKVIDDFTGDVVVTVTNNAVPTGEVGDTATADLNTELAATIGTVKLTSDALSTASVTITVTKDDSTGNLKFDVEGGTNVDWSSVDGEAAENK